MNPESQTPNRTPRTTYAKLREEANIIQPPKHRWELKPRDDHTKAEKQRLANQAFEDRYRDLVTSMAAVAIVEKAS